jgi:hypothetical protein
MIQIVKEHLMYCYTIYTKHEKNYNSANIKNQVQL